MDIDPRQVCGPVADRRVHVGGGRGDGPRPRGLVPAVGPQRTVGMRPDVLRDPAQTVVQGRGRAQIQSRQCQAGTGGVNVAVDESGCDERSVQVDDLGVRKLVAPVVVAAQPGDHAVADRHRGGFGMRRTVHPAADQECRHRAESYDGARGSAGGSTSTTSMTSPSM